MATQEPTSQIEALETARCEKIFREKISTRVQVRPEPAKTPRLAASWKKPPPASR
jgi:hypothetical protein